MAAAAISRIQRLPRRRILEVRRGGSLLRGQAGLSHTGGMQQGETALRPEVAPRRRLLEPLLGADSVHAHAFAME